MRVLVTSTPGLGHVHPVVPLATALQVAGHEVRWAVAPEAVPTLESYGFAAWPAGLDRADASRRANQLVPDLLARMMALPPRDRSSFVFTFTFAGVQAPPMLEDLLRLVQEWRPDVMVHEPNELAAPPVARRLGVPHIVVGYGACPTEERWVTAEEPMRKLWAMVGETPPASGGLYDDLYLHPLPPAFGEPPPLRTVHRIQPVGFDGSDAVSPLMWSPPSGSSRPLIYVTFGTEVANLSPIGLVIAALAGVEADVVLTVGRTLDPEAWRPWPENVKVFRYLPQRTVLARSSLLVSHAGSGAMLGAAAAGLPQLCLPVAADQFVNADAVVNSGVGLSLDPEAVNAESLRAGVLRLLVDDGYRDRAQAVAGEIERMPRPERLVATVEGIASGSRTT